MGYWSNIKKLYFTTFFHALIPAYVIERLFWEQRGIDLRHVFYCEVIYGLTVAVLEIPSGVLADKISRKRLLFISALLCSAEFLLLIFAHGFPMFAFVVFLSGIGKSLSSGTDNAFLYDSLLAEGKEKSFEKIAGRLNAIDFISSSIAALLGGLLAAGYGLIRAAGQTDYASGSYSLELNYWLSLASVILAAIITLTLKEPPVHTKPEGGDAWRHTRKAAAFFRSHFSVLYFCLTGAFLGACLNYLDEFWQLLLQEIGTPLVLFGLVGACVMLLRALGGILAYRIKDRFEHRTIFLTATALTAAGLAAICFTRSLLCLIPMMAVSFITGMVDPITEGCVQHNVDGDVRATASSFVSLGRRVISIATGLVFVAVSESVSISVGFGALGLLCAVYLIWFRIAVGLQSKHNRVNTDDMP